MEISFHYVVEITTGEDELRLDRYLADEQELCRRSQLKQRLLSLQVNGRDRKVSFKVREGDVITGTLAPPVASDAVAQPVDLAVIREEREFLVIDKPQGLVVHPGAGNPDQTLVNGLLWRYQDRMDSDLVQAEPNRPGIVHRLDKDTSGVMIIARSLEVHQYLVEQFSSGSIRKRYIALVKGSPRGDGGTLETRLGRDPDQRRRYAVVEDGGKPAVTNWKVLRRYENYSLILLQPSTGRTHQLRVHMAHLGIPILGDPIYARRDRRHPEATLMLHALSLRISPAPGWDAHEFRAVLPERFIPFLR